MSAANVDEYLGASIKLTGFAAIRCASSLVSLFNARRAWRAAE